jgi:hypothetical protein
MKNNIEKPKTLKELKKIKGSTNWAKLVSDEKKESNRVAGGI